MSRVLRRLPLVAWLTAVWVALWDEVTLANLVGGLTVAVALSLVFRLPRLPAPGGTIRPLWAVAFLAYFLWKLVEASAVVAWEVMTPRNRINEGIIAVPIQGASDVLATVVANAVTLTPGTLTLELERDPTVLYVHVLHLRSIEATRDDVRRLERLVVRAFGPTDAVRRLESGRGVDRSGSRARGEGQKGAER